MFKFFKNLWRKLSQITHKPFGLYISDSSLEAVEIKGGAKNPVVKSMGRLDLPAGVVDRGWVINQKVLASQILEMLKKTSPEPIKSKDCIVSIPENEVFEHIFYLSADLEGDALESKLEELIEETIPVSYTHLTLPTSDLV